MARNMPSVFHSLQLDFIMAQHKAKVTKKGHKQSLFAAPIPVFYLVFIYHRINDTGAVLSSPIPFAIQNSEHYDLMVHKANTDWAPKIANKGYGSVYEHSKNRFGKPSDHCCRPSLFIYRDSANAKGLWAKPLYKRTTYAEVCGFVAESAMIRLLIIPNPKTDGAIPSSMSTLPSIYFDMPQ